MKMLEKPEMFDWDPWETRPKQPVAYSECPISKVEGFVSEHWDAESICEMFWCRECVAVPEDFGWYPEPPVADGSMEIPF